jgi:hypothetical protein
MPAPAPFHFEPRDDRCPRCGGEYREYSIEVRGDDGGLLSIVTGVCCVDCRAGRLFRLSAPEEPAEH